MSCACRGKSPSSLARPGVGRAICERFAREGARVVVTGRTVEDGEAVAAGIRAAGGEAVFVRCDVTVEDDVRAAMAVPVEMFGRLDVLINNAAAIDVLRQGPDRQDGTVVAMETAGWEAIMRGGATSAYWACKYAIPALAASGGGSIISISSVVTQRGIRGFAGHSASKSALEAITRSVAVECAADNIRANCLILGFISDSSSGQAMRADPAQRAAMQALHLTRPARTGDVAAAALLLASDEASAITGAKLTVDGGLSIKRAG